MRQLSGHDAAYIYSDSAHANSNVTLLHIYDQSTAPGGKVRFKEILAHIENRLSGARSFRQKLVRVPFDLDHPYWIEDKDFDLAFIDMMTPHHVGAVTMAKEALQKCEKPEIKKLEFVIIKNEAVALQALKKGDVDSYNLRPLQWTRQTDSAKFKHDFEKIKYLATSYRYIGYNMRRPPFNDRRVRQAMAHLMDLERVKKTILENLAEVTTGPFLPQSLQYNQNLKPLQYEPEKALELLKAAGYSRNADGLIAKDNKPLEIELMVSAGGGFADQFASVMKEDFSRAGITLNIRKLEFQTLLTKINQRDFQSVMLGWSSGIESDPFQLWHTSQREKGHNFTGFGDAASDAMIEQARLTFDDKARNAIYHKFHERVYNDQPYTFLYTSYALIAVSKRFTNVNVYPLGLDLLEWKLAKPAIH